MSSALGSQFSELIARARQRYSFAVDDTILVDLLARTAELDDDARASDLPDELVLAAACLANDTTALGRFDRDYGDELRGLIRSVVGDSARDAVQDIWARLLVATPERPLPRLADYGGRGSLRTWLRVVAAREAVSVLRKRRELAVDDDAVFGRLVDAMDPKLALIRSRSATEVKRAFEQAVADSSVRERNLLRQHLLDGLSIDELARLYHVHRATAARWVANARDDVWKRTQRALRERLELTPSEMASLLGEVRDWIDLSLERVLR